MRRLDIQSEGLGALARHCSALAADLVASGAPQSAVPGCQATARATQMLHTSISAVNDVMRARLIDTAVALTTSEIGFVENEAGSADKLASIITTPGT